LFARIRFQLVTTKYPQKNSSFLWNPAGKNYGFGGEFLWVWIMGDEISEHPSACHQKLLLKDIMGSHDAKIFNVMGS
jgi:hypothetical protein